MHVEERKNVSVAVIGTVYSCFPEKFGIPRQAGLAPSATGIIELYHPYNRRELCNGLEGFSHIWIYFLFHKAIDEGWKSTVRPPRLGGIERRGVFATRSPHRPNHLGMSAVELLGMRNIDGKMRLYIGGIDLLDKTPVLDIKPYIPYSDCLPDASASDWVKDPVPHMQIIFTKNAQEFCDRYERKTGRKLSRLICEILLEDPRPASQKGKKQDFGMRLWEVNITWTASVKQCTVVDCTFM